MDDSLIADQPANRRLKRHRWRGLHPDLADVSPAERALEATVHAATVLAAALARSEQFMAAAQDVHAGRMKLDDVARRYARKPGAGRDFIARLLLLAGEAPTAQLAQFQVMNVAYESAVWSDVELEPGARKRWRDPGYKAAAAMIVRRGAGLCLQDGCPVEVGHRRGWCDPHLPAVEHQAAPIRAMGTLLAAAASALPHGKEMGK